MEIFKKELIFCCFAVMLLTSCAPIHVPKELANQKEFSIETSMDYIHAYKIISRQMKACFRGIGLAGNGYEVESILNTEGHVGTIEIYYIGLSGADSSYKDSSYGRLVTINKHSDQTHITIQGTSTDWAYYTRNAIERWLQGGTTCSGKPL
ncbi:hypothetical protein [Halodesulfovibrio aestuarii]|uniref:Lipoprotein n=1 Tax=Halodesulfovibrio aestuarii TaxID=126333 RepID=A0ABV4JWE7_9BACT